MYIYFFFFILGLFKDGNINKSLKTLFENNDYLKLIVSRLGSGAKEITSVIQVS